MESQTFDQKKQQKFKKIRYAFSLNSGILLMAIGIYFFKAPRGFATGGVSGISIIFAKIFETVLPFSQADYNIFLNILLLIVGIIVLGKKCGGLTVYCSLILVGLNKLFESLNLVSLLSNGMTSLTGKPVLTSQPVLELVYAVILTGIGSGIIFNCNASSGGTDILALILKKYTKMDVGKALLCVDALVAFSTFFIFGIETGLYAVVGLFSKVFVIDNLIESMNMYKAFMIVTTRPEEIDKYIFDVLDHSSTIVDAIGAYSGEKRKLVITVCRRREAMYLRRKIKAIDPHSFMIITNTTEILGKGFREA